MHVAVTGAGTGIGRAIASRLVAEGARVSALARDVSRLDVGEAYACDIRNRDDAPRTAGARATSS